VVDGCGGGGIEAVTAIGALETVGVLGAAETVETGIESEVEAGAGTGAAGTEVEEGIEVEGMIFVDAGGA